MKSSKIANRQPPARLPAVHSAIICGLFWNTGIKSRGRSSICPQCAHSLAQERPRKQPVRLKARRNAGRAAGLHALGGCFRGCLIWARRRRGQPNKAKREGLSRPTEVGVGPQPPCHCSFPAAAPSLLLLLPCCCSFPAAAPRGQQQQVL